MFPRIQLLWRIRSRCLRKCSQSGHRVRRVPTEWPQSCHRVATEWPQSGHRLSTELPQDRCWHKIWDIMFPSEGVFISSRQHPLIHPDWIHSVTCRRFIWLKQKKEQLKMLIDFDLWSYVPVLASYIQMAVVQRGSDLIHVVPPPPPPSTWGCTTSGKGAKKKKHKKN